MCPWPRTPSPRRNAPRTNTAWSLSSANGGGQIQDGLLPCGQVRRHAYQCRARLGKSYLHALTSIGAGLGLAASWYSAGAAERDILQSLQAAPRLIIIDEANHFNRATLNFLKTVLNLTRCGLVLLTLPHHMARMSSDSREEFPQLLRRSIAIIHIPSITGEEVAAIRRGLYPQVDLPNAAPLCALANQFHNLDTVRRVLDEIDAGQTPEAAVKAVRRQIQPISTARS